MPEKLLSYKTELYNESYNEAFMKVYNNFKDSAVKNYNFELAPLSYENFIKSVNEGLLQCIILLEDDIPVGFLVYTTIVSESIELNIIHCIDSENINQKRQLLLEKFIELNKNLLKEKVITYPMLGNQSEFVDDILCYGFKTVSTSVMKIDLKDLSLAKKIKSIPYSELEEGYVLTNWKSSYLSDAAEVIHQSFKNSSDVLFDARFKTYKGCCDIVKKITENIYGKFLPSITKVLLYKKRPVGFCFVNLTNEEIANLPIVAILKNHRSKGYSKTMLGSALFDLLNNMVTDNNALKELNASCDSDNYAAVCMYNALGFSEDYRYPLAYHPGLE